MRRARYQDADLAELAASIQSVGLLEPLLVRPHPAAPSSGIGDEQIRFELVAGERRWLAAGRIDLPIVPVLVRELSDLQVLETQLVENLQREGLGPLEEAEGYRELMRIRSVSADQLAEMIGKSRSWVYSRLKLLQLLPAAQDALARGALDASRGLLVARIGDPKRQAKALKLAVEKNWRGDATQMRGLEGCHRRQVQPIPARRAVRWTTPPSGFENAGQTRLWNASAARLPRLRALPGNCVPHRRSDVANVPCWERKRAQHGERYRAARGRGTASSSPATRPRPSCHADKTVGHLDLDDIAGSRAPVRRPSRTLRRR